MEPLVSCEDFLWLRPIPILSLPHHSLYTQWAKNWTVSEVTSLWQVGCHIHHIPQYIRVQKQYSAIIWLIRKYDINPCHTNMYTHTFQMNYAINTKNPHKKLEAPLHYKYSVSKLNKAFQSNNPLLREVHIFKKIPIYTNHLMTQCGNVIEITSNTLHSL